MNKVFKEVLIQKKYDEKGVDELIEYLGDIGYEIKKVSDKGWMIFDIQIGELYSNNIVTITEVIKFVISFYEEWIEGSGKPNLEDKDLEEQISSLELIKKLV